MRLTRRLLLTGAASALLLPRQALAVTELEFGTLRIDSVSDGHLTLPPAFALEGLPPEEAAALTARHNLPSDMHRPPCNLTLLRDGTRTVLFDAGSGSDFMGSAGKIFEALAALDLSPEDITHLVITHGHPDHIWGLLDEFDEPAFPNAELIIGAEEFAYWTDPETAATIGAERESFAAGAMRRLRPFAETIRQLANGEEVFPGLIARATPGHTPGHMSYELTTPEGAFWIIGDVIGNPHIAFERPDWESGSDQDPSLGAKTRVTLLEALATSQARILGYHLTGSGIGKVQRDGDAYRFEEI